ncbi:DUF4197 domain-containing protein [Parapedobacter sp. 10938]|uniref:DUF4197 domain-containing protein n=1 Tax=Parapedobacter flavus TaxID=3110225 RepID=UPI002DB7E53D|nr:DUF4197 domain-containing protein [Parapedobacter sp. 10938]MEC3879934.1 DUF4197 domain-containing protein [Parapedobacter sp. 10938]
MVISNIKKAIYVAVMVGFFAMPPAQAQSIFDKVKKAVNDKQKSETSEDNKKSNADLTGISTGEMSGALKEALNIGVKEGIQKLGTEDGFFKNELVKVLLPEKLRKVDATLRGIGLGSLADQGLLLLNRAAEDAVQEGVPIFANAITSMSFDDAKNILLGDSVAATNYLKGKTSEQLFTAFKPKVEGSLGKVGADKIWEQIISKYNGITKQSIETDLNTYVTQETVSGVFKMVAEKESAIRDNSVFRTTSLLKKVFGAID